MTRFFRPADWRRCPPLFLVPSTVVALLVLGCQPGPETPAGFTVTDSAGVTIARSSLPLWSEGEEWTIPPEPEVTIGEADGEEGYILDEVMDVKRFGDGRIAVLDGGSSRVRVYDPAGLHLFDVGGPGEGPSELSRAHFLALRRDTIVVYEYMPPTLTWFDDDGNFLRSTTLASHLEGGPPYGMAFGFLGGEAVIVAAPVVRPDYRPGRAREKMSIWSLPLAAVRADSLTEIRTDEIVVHNTGGWNNLTFGATTYLAASDSAIYVAPSETYDIQVLDGQGKLRRIVRKDVEPRPVEPDDAYRWAEQISAALQQDPELAARRAARVREIGMAQVMPAYRMVTVDAEENLWVEEWDDVGIEMGAFSVFRSDGAWLGRVTLPPGLPLTRGTGLLTSVLDIGSDFLLGVWVDDLGVEQVRLYRIDKG